MKTYIKILLMIIGLHWFFNTYQRLKFLRKIKKAAKETVEDETEKETKKTTKDAMKGIFGKKKKKKEKNKVKQKSKNDNSKTQGSNSSSNNKGTINKSQDIVSGSQFFPNGQILFYERFERDKRGDYPVNWITDVGGEIVMVNDAEKALYIYDDAQAILDIDPLPENCVIEFDLITQNIHGISDELYVQLVSEKKFGNISSGGSVELLISNSKGHNDDIGVENWGIETHIDSNPSLSFWKYLERTTHITIVKNKNRFRFYLDNYKVLDLPSFLGDESGKYLRFKRDNLHADKSDEIIAIANVKITEEVKDIRSQLLKGDLSTNKILFETGSSTIETESEDILNTIGKVLEDNPDLQYLVIGHTDNVGDSEKNKTLSQQRAKAVIDYFIANFEISKSNLIPVGKGESEPVATNDTENGKQQNRRVQFKKL